MVALPLPPAFFAWVIPLTVAAGLWLDTALGAPGIVVVNVWVWGLYVALLLSVEPSRRRPLFTCLVLATAGELVLTEWWSAYTYRAGFLPAYVPPGHCLLYHLGVLLSRRLPTRRVERTLPRWVYVFQLALVAAVVWRWEVDTVGSATALAVGVMVWRGQNRGLYATMAVLSLLMELWGTLLAVWIWSPNVAGTSLLMANPPLGVGILYCTLDALVLAFAGGRTAPSG